jgi:hypothetical protein
MLLGAALFGRRPRAEGSAPSGGMTLAAAAGGLAPDLTSFVLVGAALAGGMDGQAVFRDAWFSPAWQAIMAPSHSIPLWTAAVVLALALRVRTAGAFAASGLLHQAFDFPLHGEDAHRHFWPLSNWRFESPVSYWDPAQGGAIVGTIELALGLGLVVWFWRRWSGRRARAALVLTGLVYALQGAAIVAFAVFGLGGP